MGTSACVPTSEDDTVVYAQRHGRGGLTRFVLEKSPIPTHFLTVILGDSDPDSKNIYDTDAYVLLTACVGEPAPREPSDIYFEKRTTDLIIMKEYEEAVAFWDAHALVYDESVIIPGTETKELPWGV